MPIFSINAPTLAELRTAVSARGYALTTDGIDAAINGAYREVIAARRWAFQDTASTALTITTGADSVSLGGIEDLLHIDAVRLDNGDASCELDWWPTQVLRREANLDRTTAVPDYWTRQGGELLLYPRPNDDFLLAIDYTPDVPALAADDDQIVIPRLYMDAVVWGAVAELAYRQRDYASADRAEKKRDDAVLRMARAYGMEQRQGGRRVTETGFWDGQA